jgi:two-component system nitrate/nitrite sensor histidine kinase NarX
MVNDYVSDIDDFLVLLEQEAEGKINRLKAIQAVTLVLTLSVILITMYLLRAKILGPLSSLLYCAENARKGNFSVRTSYTDDDELGQVGMAFNVMAADLSKMYADWEACVQEKTLDLERSNRSLELLYNSIKRLSEAPLSDATYEKLLRDLEEPLGIGPGAICLSDASLDKPFILASTRKTLHGGPDICAQANCNSCFGGGDTHVLEMKYPECKTLQLISIPILDQEKQVGVLLMEIHKESHLEEWQKQLLEAVAQHIAMALNITQRFTESRRLTLHEERSVIARELHDSLAQSLSYLKIQATRLDVALAKSSNGEVMSPIIGEMREGISSAYRQLRELLTTFRLKMDGRGLASAMENTVREFTERSDITITLNNQLNGCQLNAHEEIHVLQVVREVLSNAASHSKAKSIDVDLQYDVNGNQAMVSVEDDGVGMPDQPEKVNHYGLAIINERAEMLGGRIEMLRRPAGGTRVELTFSPSLRQ